MRTGQNVKFKYLPAKYSLYDRFKIKTSRYGEYLECHLIDKYDLSVWTVQRYRVFRNSKTNGMSILKLFNDMEYDYLNEINEYLMQ